MRFPVFKFYLSLDVVQVFFDNVEAQPCALDVEHIGSPEKYVENEFHLFFGDADSLVFDLDQVVMVGSVQLNQNGAPCTRILDGIGYNIIDDVFEAGGV